MSAHVWSTPATRVVEGGAVDVVDVVTGSAFARAATPDGTTIPDTTSIAITAETSHDNR